MRYLLLLIALVLNATLISAQTTFKIKVNQPPKLVLIVEKDSLIKLGESINLGPLISVNGGKTPFTYNWSPASTLNSPDIPNPSATPVEAVTYYLTVTDSNKCIVRDSIKVNVQVSTDVLEAGKPNIKIYPVPVTRGVLYMRLVDIKGPLNFSILDINGNVIKKNILPDSEGETVLQIPMSVKSGTYFLKIDYNNRSVVKQFIVIQK
jgi:hypothetical protein